MRMQSRFVHMLAATSVAILAAVGSAAPAYAVGNGDKALFGPISVPRGAGQVVRLALYGLGGPDTAPWEFSIRIFNVRGELVRSMQLEQGPGLTGFAEVAIQDSEDFPADTHGRRTMRAEIVGFNPQPDPPGVWFATLEAFGRSGRTSAFIGNPDVVPGHNVQ